MNNCKICGAQIADTEELCEECKAKAEQPGVELAVDETTKLVGEAIPVENTEVSEENAEVSGATSEEIKKSEEITDETTGIIEGSSEVTDGSIEKIVETSDISSESEGETNELTENEEIGTSEAEEEKSKKEGGWNYITTIVVVIAAALCLTILTVFASYTGWIDQIMPKTKSSFTMQNYTNIEILNSVVQVTDALVDENMDSILSSSGYEEFNDENISILSEYYLGKACSTEEEMRELLREQLYKSRYETAVYDYLDTITTVKTYDEEKLELLKGYYNTSLDSYASQYGTTADTYAQYMGYESADAYAQYLAEYYLKMEMIEDKILKANGIDVTDDDINAKLNEYLDENGYSSYYTVDTFKEAVGDNWDSWKLIFTIAEVKHDLMMDAVKDSVIIMEDATE